MGIGAEMVPYEKILDGACQARRLKMCHLQCRMPGYVGYPKDPCRRGNLGRSALSEVPAQGV